LTSWAAISFSRRTLLSVISWLVGWLVNFRYWSYVIQSMTCNSNLQKPKTINY